MAKTSALAEHDDSATATTIEVPTIEHNSADVAYMETARAAERRVAEAENEMNVAKSIAKAKKEAFDLAVNDLRRVIRNGPNDQLELPFDNDAEAWRAVSVTELVGHGATQKAVDIIIQASMTTLGELSDFMATTEVDALDGVGEVTAEKVKGALTAWFAANPDKCPPTKEDDGNDDDGMGQISDDSDNADAA
ncbi:MAG: hypothetical protein U1E51_02830 [Candidatus Binatia bacterium]|nr:hypothetical protein [Candidatus Binatia bacterium]